MIWGIIGLCIVVLGAVCNFTADKLYKRFFNKELSQAQLAITKMISLGVIVLGAIVVFRFGGRI